MELLIGFLAGAIVTGIIAHRKPEWFNRAVAIVNKADDQVNAQVKGQ
jgi:hypothetical protein